ncbi:MAG: dihydrolipoamide acetyltransferase family protein [Nannocystaceae bacterium]
MYEFKLPEIGEGVIEGEIVRWLKRPGERVSANEGLLEVMTDKATVEIPSPIGGTVREHTAAEGDICPVGTVIARLSPEEETKTAAKPVSHGVPRNGDANPARGREAKILATPAARALARERGVDLTSVDPDEHGRVTKRTVLGAIGPRVANVPTTPPTTSGAALPAGKPASPPASRATVATQAASPPPPPRRSRAREEPADTYIPFRGMRRRIAESVKRAYSNAVHFTYVEEIDVERLVRLRNEAKDAAKEQGVSLTYLPFVVKAVIHALRKFPIVNAELDERNARIILKRRYHIGIATTTEHGLAVPVLRDADQLSLLDISREISRLGDATRAGTATSSDLTGSTFSITSLGLLGGMHATPILNHPEVGILGVHAIRRVPVFDANDNVVPGRRMNLSISFDHRVVDGFEGASFLHEIKRYLEDPTLLFLAGI